MHDEAMAFLSTVKLLFPEKFYDTDVLEIGSRNINGSPREMFLKPHRYVGVDLSEGPGVDLVLHSADLSDVRYREFDVVVSTEALEHDARWEETLKTSVKFLRPHGLLIFTCAGPERHEHGTHRYLPSDSPMTNDHYRNLTIEDVESVFGDFSLFDAHEILYSRHNQDLNFWGLIK